MKVNLGRTSSPFTFPDIITNIIWDLFGSLQILDGDHRRWTDKDRSQQIPTETTDSCSVPLWLSEILSYWCFWEGG